MKQLVLLVLCNSKEQERLKSIISYRYDIKLIIFDKKEHYKFIDYLNNNDIDLILIENSIEDKLTILNRYKNKEDYNKTIIVDNMKLECYKYLDNNLFNVFPDNYDKELLYICLDIILKTNNGLNIPLYQKIADILNKTNLPNNRIGYKYIQKAIYESFQDPSLLDNLTKKLYPFLSKTYNKSIYSIEKAIRTAISSAMNSINDEFNNKLFAKYTTYYKTSPTTQEFILTIVNNLLIEYGKVS